MDPNAFWDLGTLRYPRYAGGDEKFMYRLFGAVLGKSRQVVGDGKS